MVWFASFPKGSSIQQFINVNIIENALEAAIKILFFYTELNVSKITKWFFFIVLSFYIISTRNNLILTVFRIAR